MAVKKEQTAKLVLKVQTGTGSNGAAVFNQRSFAHINPLLSDDDFVDIAQALGALQMHTVGAISRQDAAELSKA